jgi:hypothetical protein
LVFPFSTDLQSFNHRFSSAFKVLRRSVGCGGVIPVLVPLKSSKIDLFWVIDWSFEYVKKTSGFGDPPFQETIELWKWGMPWDALGCPKPIGIGMEP